jgi:signal transduction histidine kinase
MSDLSPQGQRRRWWAGLGWKLFVAFALVIAVGVVTLWLVIGLTAPRFFDLQMGGMMDGPNGGMMAAAMNEALAVAFRDALTEALLVGTAAAVISAIAASVFVTGRIVELLRRLAAASRRIADGHYAERVPVSSGDELGDLAHSFNTMAGALEDTERRRRELIGDVAHELRTPIATLEGYLEGLLDGVVEPSPPTWARLHDEAGRLRRLVDDLQELSRAEARQIPLAIRPTDPAQISTTAVDRFSGSFEEKGLEFRSEVPSRLPPVNADPDRAVQVLSNLLGNALRYTPAPGCVELQVSASDGVVEFSVARLRSRHLR